MDKANEIFDMAGKVAVITGGSRGLGAQMAHAFAAHGVLLASGIGMELPTGDDEKRIGSDNEVELERFLGIGYGWRKLEIIAVASLGAA